MTNKEEQEKLYKLIMTAAVRCDVEAAKKFIQTDTKADSVLGINDITPLYMASQYGCAEVVKLLLAQDGIEVNKALSNNGRTPMYVACQKGHTEIVKLLLRKDGIDANKAKTDGTTPLLTAGRGGHTEIVKLLQGE